MLLAVGALGGCSMMSKDFNREPSLTPIGSGLTTEQTILPARVRHPDKTISTNSTWRASGKDFFRDARAREIGDVITVKIFMKDKATLDNSTSRKRDAKRSDSLDLTYDIGIGGLARSGSGAVDSNIDASTSTAGQGKIQRSETIEFLVAAVVTEVLPNGNLVISGSQEVRVNYEMRILTVAGIVQPRDIAADNNISYEKIAEARISYGGRGRINEVQQPGWGQQVLDTVLPF